MQRRSEANKQMKLQFRKKLKRTAAMVLCLLFAYSAIYAADVSNKRMLNKRSEDSYALRLSITTTDQLRMDLAGTQHYMNVSEMKSYMVRASEKAMKAASQLKEGALNLLDSIKK